MQWQCNGRYFETDAAKLVGSGGDSEWHNGGWHLYQMPSGEFFKVVYGYEGEEIGINTMRYQDGKALAESAPVNALAYHAFASD